ncbi:MAG TPA: hypothetical protein VEW66_07940, partial [Thermomicrobiales bacterium]|nr:hypothetical protein [Thermomicrobiales bacterium]
VSIRSRNCSRLSTPGIENDPDSMLFTVCLQFRPLAVSYASSMIQRGEQRGRAGAPTVRHGAGLST